MSPRRTTRWRVALIGGMDPPLKRASHDLMMSFEPTIMLMPGWALLEECVDSGAQRRVLVRWNGRIYTEGKRQKVIERSLGLPYHVASSLRDQISRIFFKLTD